MKTIIMENSNNELIINKDRDVYFLKNIPLGKMTFLKSLEIVLKKTEWWNSKKSFAIWWKKMKGVNVKNKKNKQFKYFILGLDLYNLKFWINITYLGNKIKENGINLHK